MLRAAVVPASVGGGAGPAAPLTRTPTPDPFGSVPDELMNL